MSGPRDRNEVRRLYDVHSRALLAYACAFLHDPSEADAAVRYWTAFALLQDPPANEGATALLLRVAEGAVPRDEAQLGPILDANAQALAIMERASTLRSCDWGIEFGLGPNAPIPHLARARVLGRRPSKSTNSVR